MTSHQRITPAEARWLERADSPSITDLVLFSGRNEHASSMTFLQAEDWRSGRRPIDAQVPYLRGCYWLQLLSDLPPSSRPATVAREYVRAPEATVEVDVRMPEYLNLRSLIWQWHHPDLIYSKLFWIYPPSMRPHVPIEEHPRHRPELVRFGIYYVSRSKWEQMALKHGWAPGDRVHPLHVPGSPPIEEDGQPWVHLPTLRRAGIVPPNIAGVRYRHGRNFLKLDEFLRGAFDDMKIGTSLTWQHELLAHLGIRYKHKDQTFLEEDLVNENFAAKHFTNCEWVDCDLSFATLRRAQFIGCRFTRCTFVGADIREARFTGCVFEECEWTSARVSRYTLVASCAGFSATDPHIKKCFRKPRSTFWKSLVASAGLRSKRSR